MIAVLRIYKTIKNEIHKVWTVTPDHLQVRTLSQDLYHTQFQRIIGIGM